MKNNKVVKYLVIAFVAVIALTGVLTAIFALSRILVRIMDIFAHAFIAAVVICAIVAVVIFILYKLNQNKKKNMKQRIINEFGLDENTLKPIRRMEEVSNLKAFFESVTGIDDCNFYAKFTKEGYIYVEARDKVDSHLEKAKTIKDYNSFLDKFAPVR